MACRLFGDRSFLKAIMIQFSDVFYASLSLSELLLVYLITVTHIAIIFLPIFFWAEFTLIHQSCL